MKSPLADMMPRPPLPGEVWKFSPIEVHCFYMELERIRAFLDEDNEHLSLWHATFEPIFKENAIGRTTTGITVTPTSGDRAFFTALTAGARAHLWALPKGFELPVCGHFSEEHQNTLKEWFEREIVQAKKFSATIRILESMTLEDKAFGKQILARSDVERLIEEDMERSFKNLQSTDSQLIKELIDICGHTPESAREFADKMHRNAVEETRSQLEELYSKNYRIIED